jgi:hypothetical protein
MWFPESSLLSSADPSTRFVVLAWAEMFGQITPDSYRPRLLDTYALLDELAIVSEQAMMDSRWLAHLSHVKKELSYTAKRDLILTEHYPHAADALATIEQRNSPSQLRSIANALRSRIEDHSTKVQQDLLRRIENLPRHKAEALRAIRAVGSLAVRTGLPRDHCRDLAAEPHLSLEPAAAAEHILLGLSPGVQRWRVILALVGDASEVRALIDRTNFRPLPKRLKPLGGLATSFLKSAEGMFLIYTETDARVASHALGSSVQKLQRILDIASFYHRSPPFAINDAFVQSMASRDAHRLFKVEKAGVSGLRPQRRATDLAISVQRSGLLDRLPERIIASLEQHSLALQVPDTRSRFVNLWVALETLIGRAAGEGIIERIVRSVAPLIAHRGINNTVKYLAICLHDFGLCNRIADPTGWFKSSNRRMIVQEELILLLTGAAGDTTLRALFALTSPHPLLCNRLFTEYTSLVDPRMMVNHLKELQLRAEWQLRRIYRARNLILHEGETVPFLPQLLENLEYYFSLTLSRVVSDLQRKPDWLIEDSVEHRRIVFEYILGQAERDPSVVTVSDILEDSKDSANLPLWPEKVGHTS